MKDETYQAARLKIADAVARARLAGATLSLGHFGVAPDFASQGQSYYRNGNTCCPIGCLLLGTAPHNSLVADAAAILGVNQFAVLHFIRGYEGSQFSFSKAEIQAGRVPYDREFYDLGVEYRLELALESKS